MTPTSVNYGFGTRLNVPYAEAIDRVKAALKDQGFGILTEIDVKATLKAKLGVDFRNYIILGACNPPLAHRALSTELSIGLLLPCNVIVYEDEGGSVVEFMDPEAALGLTGNAAVSSVACDAKERLQKAAAALAQ